MFRLFKTTSPDYCAACNARKEHLDDLRRLLDIEQSRTAQLLYQRVASPLMPNQESALIRGIPPTLGSLRTRAEEAELMKNADAKKDFWQKREKEYKALNDEIAARAVLRKKNEEEEMRAKSNPNQENQSPEIPLNGTVAQDSESA